MRRQVFAHSELSRVPPGARPVVLRSGGPVMDLEGVGDGIGLCRWRGDDGKIHRAQIPVAALYSCVPCQKNEVTP